MRNGEWKMSAHPFCIFHFSLLIFHWSLRRNFSVSQHWQRHLQLSCFRPATSVTATSTTAGGLASPPQQRPTTQHRQCDCHADECD